MDELYKTKVSANMLKRVIKEAMIMQYFLLLKLTTQW